MSEEAKPEESFLGSDSEEYSLISPAFIEAADAIVQNVLGVGAEAWATNIDRGVHFTPGRTEFKTPADTLSSEGGQPVVTTIEWTGDRSGSMTLIVSEAGAKGLIAYFLALAYGNEADPEATKLDEEGLDAYNELVNTLLGQASQALRSETGGDVNLAQTSTRLADFKASPPSVEFGVEDILCHTGQITIEGMTPVTVYLLMPQSVTGVSSSIAERSGSSAAEMEGGEKPENRLAAMKIKVPLIVVLAQKKVRMEVIQGFNPGSIIEFRKLSGENLDICAGETKFAEGEVVIVNDHFGIQIKRFVDVRTALASRG